MPSFIYDICICYHPKDSLIFDYCIESIQRYLPEVNTIYVISKEKPEVEGITWIDESIFPFSKEDVGTYIQSPERVGWYYQQLLKLYCYRVLPSLSQHILILDSDVILKQHIDFFEGDTILLAKSPEHTPPYFIHMEKLIPGLEQQIPYSGIVHHMMTNRVHMEHLLTSVEKIHDKSAWKAMLSLVDPEHHGKSGMSEYEIYFNYCLKNFPEMYKVRDLPFANCTNFQDFLNQKVALVALHSWMLE